MDQEAENAEQTQQGGRLKRVKAWLKVVSFYGKWLLDKLIKFLNQVSRDYRAVARQLKKARQEKRLKEMLEQAGSQSRSRERTSSVSAEEDETDAKVNECMATSCMAMQARFTFTLLYFTLLYFTSLYFTSL